MFQHNSILGEFTQYGTDVLAMTELAPEEREDPMARVFPKMTKCTFHKFGPSGTVEKFDGLCVLPLNIINEKIYVFLWFWFIILTIITGMQLIYRSVFKKTKYIWIQDREHGTLFALDSAWKEIPSNTWIFSGQDPIFPWCELLGLGKP